MGAPAHACRPLRVAGVGEGGGRATRVQEKEAGRSFFGYGRARPLLPPAPRRWRRARWRAAAASPLSFALARVSQCSRTFSLLMPMKLDVENSSTTLCVALSR